MSLGRFCGSSIPSPITSSTNKIKVIFHSGTTLSGFVGGFGLSYESVNLEGMLENKLPFVENCSPMSTSSVYKQLLRLLGLHGL